MALARACQGRTGIDSRECSTVKGLGFTMSENSLSHIEAHTFGIISVAMQL